MLFWNGGTFSWISSVQGLPVILKWHYLQSLDKALDLFIEFKFCESDFNLLNGSKNCMVATYNFGSVYIHFIKFHEIPFIGYLVWTEMESSMKLRQSKGNNSTLTDNILNKLHEHNLTVVISIQFKFY